MVYQMVINTTEAHQSPVASARFVRQFPFDTRHCTLNELSRADENFSDALPFAVFHVALDESSHIAGRP